MNETCQNLVNNDVKAFEYLVVAGRVVGFLRTIRKVSVGDMIEFNGSFYKVNENGSFFHREDGSLVPVLYTSMPLNSQ